MLAWLLACFGWETRRGLGGGGGGESSMDCLVVLCCVVFTLAGFVGRWVSCFDDVYPEQMSAGNVIIC